MEREQASGAAPAAFPTNRRRQLFRYSERRL